MVGFRDPLMLAKLNFFMNLASSFGSFLRMYQTPKAMFPFLHDSLEEIIREVMGRFVKKDILDNAKSSFKLIQIDVKNADNLTTLTKIDIGVSAMVALKACGISERDKLIFFKSCRVFLQPTTEKLMERSPLKFAIFRASSCLIPKQIVQYPTRCSQRMENLVQELLKKKRIKGVTGDKVVRQYKILLNQVSSEKELKEKFLNFSIKKDELDSFFTGILHNKEEFFELWGVIKMILILSHGNAYVESGFSINKQVLVENLKEESLVAIRQVYDAVKVAGGVSNVDVNKNMIQSVRGARSRYEEALEKKRKKKIDSKASEIEDRKRKADEIRVLQAKQRKMLENAKAIAQQLKELES